MGIFQLYWQYMRNIAMMVISSAAAASCVLVQTIHPNELNEMLSVFHTHIYVYSISVSNFNAINITVNSDWNLHELLICFNLCVVKRSQFANAVSKSQKQHYKINPNYIFISAWNAWLNLSYILGLDRIGSNRIESVWYLECVAARSLFELSSFEW